MINANIEYPITIIKIEQPAHQTMLKTAAQTISFPLAKEDQKLIQAMKEKLYELGGVGLAATQVNQAKRIAAIYIPSEAALLRDNVKTYSMHILINPSYTPVSENDLSYDFEACYSVSSTAGKVPRYKQINLSFTDEQGNLHQSQETGFYARVLQHEIDHLNGILITDRLTPDCVQGSVEEMMALRRQELPEDKKEIYDQLVKKKLKS